MAETQKLGGEYTFAGTTMRVRRMGYGAMQLAGPHVFGPPKDRQAAIGVVRAAVEAGVNHIDTSDFYGPHVVNEILREALQPHDGEVVLVTKVGARRDDQGGWNWAMTPEELTSAVHDNLRHLGREQLDVVNLRMMPKGGGMGFAEEGVAEPLGALVRLQEQGLIAALGVSHVTPEQVREARAITPIVCVQNLYNLAQRSDDALLDELARDGVAYVPYFPLGGFTPLQSQGLDAVAKELGATPMQVALAWLLHQSPNVLLIPGTSSEKHLRENLAAAELVLPDEALQRLDKIGTAGA